MVLNGFIVNGQDAPDVEIFQFNIVLRLVLVTLMCVISVALLRKTEHVLLSTNARVCLKFEVIEVKSNLHFMFKPSRYF